MSKVVFSADKARKTVTVSLPSLPGSELVFFCQLTVGQERELANKHPKYMEQGNPDQIAFMADSVAARLKSWNLTDEENVDIPLEKASEIFQAIDGGDVGHIILEIKKATENTTAGVGLEQARG